jgi:hypothetical protein
MDFVSKPKRMLVCGAVGTTGAGTGFGAGTGAAVGVVKTDACDVDGEVGAAGELPHAIDADAATNAAPPVRRRDCFVSRTNATGPAFTIGRAYRRTK